MNHYDRRMAEESALARAVEEGHAEVVRFLLACGADVHAPGWMMITPLMRASDHAKRSPDVLAMVEGAAANKCGDVP